MRRLLQIRRKARVCKTNFRIKLDNGRDFLYNAFMRVKRIKLKKLCNLRDIGGFPAADGKKIVSGKLFRSGRLYKLPKKTTEALQGLGIKTAVDMRIEQERVEHPSSRIAGIVEHNIPLLCTPATGITYEAKMAKVMREESKRIKAEYGTALNYVKSTYADILFHENSRKNIKKILDLIRDAEGGIVWYCSAGKDRTGLISMLVESLLGVDEETVVRDFCATKKFLRHKRIPQRLGLILVPAPHEFKRILFAIMDTKIEYIRGAISEIKSRYGTIVDYCKEALGVTDDDIEKLRSKYLV